MSELIAPHGGVLRDLYVDAEEAAKQKQAARDMQSWDLTPRQLCDIELLLNGAFSPLEGFLGRADYERVVSEMRLADGTVWPIPITLDVTKDFAAECSEGDRIALRDEEGVLIAVLDVADIWRPDKKTEALGVFGSEDTTHPGVHYLNHMAHEVYLGGRLTGIEAPVHYDFKHLRDSPQELRSRFEKYGWRKIVAFQTRNPMHRAHYELTFRAARESEANLLIHPVIGMTKPGDVDHFTRVRCYERVLTRYPEQTTTLSLLPLAMRMAGPREAVWHAIIRKNYGCTHLIVGRDHAGPGKDRDGNDFYGHYDAQKMLEQYEGELGIQMVPFRMMVYVRDRAQYVPVDESKEGEEVLNISGTELRRRLREGIEVPDWYSYPDVIEELRRTHPPRHQQGFAVFFTGLSGSGKSTVANDVMITLMEMGGRPVTLLDGDIVRKNLSSELGFSKAHRDLNILRIGFVASEIAKNGGIAICAPIAPYASTRRSVRDVVSQHGGFVEIYVSTPLSVCEERDRKGLYAKARAGLIEEFTGISDPYEVPESPELEVDTQDVTPDHAAHRILVKLESMGFIR